MATPGVLAACVSAAPTMGERKPGVSRIPRTDSGPGRAAATRRLRLASRELPRPGRATRTRQSRRTRTSRPRRTRTSRRRRRIPPGRDPPTSTPPAPEPGYLGYPVYPGEAGATYPSTPSYLLRTDASPPCAGLWSTRTNRRRLTRTSPTGLPVRAPAVPVRATGQHPYEPPAAYPYEPAPAYPYEPPSVYPYEAPRTGYPYPARPPAPGPGYPYALEAAPGAAPRTYAPAPAPAAWAARRRRARARLRPANGSSPARTMDMGPVPAGPAGNGQSLVRYGPRPAGRNRCLAPRRLSSARPIRAAQRRRPGCRYRQTAPTDRTMPTRRTVATRPAMAATRRMAATAGWRLRRMAADPRQRLRAGRCLRVRPG